MRSPGNRLARRRLIPEIVQFQQADGSASCGQGPVSGQGARGAIGEVGRRGQLMGPLGLNGRRSDADTMPSYLP